MSLQKRILPVICFLLISSLVQAQEDSVLFQRDSVIELYTDPTTNFFKTGEKASIPVKIFVITKTGKTLALTNLLKGIDLNTGKWVSGSGTKTFIDYTFADLDNDSNKELVISNFTGGAHCCDEIYIYKNIAPNKFQYVVKMFGGHTIITPKREFEFSFDESFGYFFTCYACGYADTTDAAPIPLRSITLRYNKGKISIVPGDKELSNTINDNLGKLGELPFGKLDDELAMDDGLRKEVAMNLAVFYYSFGRSMPETQKLFKKYYRYPDATKVWTAFTKSLLYIKKDNDF
ncbi:MAG: hypothetical protein SGI96_00305 [Bacteroidota bacterium]|nr:hypothetical protein [Bacteroidota bacterium]